MVCEKWKVFKNPLEFGFGSAFRKMVTKFSSDLGWLVWRKNDKLFWHRGTKCQIGSGPDDDNNSAELEEEGGAFRNCWSREKTLLLGCCHRSQVVNLFGNCSLISAELDSAFSAGSRRAWRTLKSVNTWPWNFGNRFPAAPQHTFFSWFAFFTRNKFLFIQCP